jgi:hypothetical protein
MAVMLKVYSPHILHYWDTANAINPGEHVLMKKLTTINEARIALLGRSGKKYMMNFTVIEATRPRFWPGQSL